MYGSKTTVEYFSKSNARLQRGVMRRADGVTRIAFSVFPGAYRATTFTRESVHGCRFGFRSVLRSTPAVRLPCPGHTLRVV